MRILFLIFLSLMLMMTSSDLLLSYSENFFNINTQKDLQESNQNTLSQKKDGHIYIDPYLRFQVAFYVTLFTSFFVLALVLKIRHMEKQDRKIYEYHRDKKKDKNN